MESLKLLRLKDLINDIKNVDATIQRHIEYKESKIITNQYIARREKLIGYLIEELNEPKYRSEFTYHFIKSLLDKFYSDNNNSIRRISVKRTSQNSFSKKDFNTLEKVLQ